MTSPRAPPPSPHRGHRGVRYCKRDIRRLRRKALLSCRRRAYHPDWRAMWVRSPFLPRSLLTWSAAPRNTGARGGAAQMIRHEGPRMPVSDLATNAARAYWEHAPGHADVEAVVPLGPAPRTVPSRPSSWSQRRGRGTRVRRPHARTMRQLPAGGAQSSPAAKAGRGHAGADARGGSGRRAGRRGALRLREDTGGGGERWFGAQPQRRRGWPLRPRGRGKALSTRHVHDARLFAVQ